VLAYDELKRAAKAERYHRQDARSGVLLQGGAHKRRSIRIAGTLIETDTLEDDAATSIER
jgi:hypothetical protein